MRKNNLIPYVVGRSQSVLLKTDKLGNKRLSKEKIGVWGYLTVV